MPRFKLNNRFQLTLVRSCVTLSRTGSPYNKGMLSLKTGSASAYSLGSLHLPDLHARIKTLIACLF